MVGESKNSFLFDNISVFFKHTDFYGAVHPYNYFEWTSYVREAFFSGVCDDFESVLKSPIKMMTAKIELEVWGESAFGDKIEAYFTATKIKKVSFDVLVRFLNKSTNKYVCQTRHTLVFVNAESGKFTDIPEPIKRAIVLYRDDINEVT